MEIILNNGKKQVMLRGSEGTFEFCELRNMKDKDKNPIQEWVPYAWHTSLSSALARFADIKISNSDARSIEELQGVVEQVKREMIDIYSCHV